MDVRFYDLNFNLIHIESLFKSVDWDISFNNAGTFEMYVSPSSPLVGIALENEFLFAFQGDRQAIITTKHFEDDRLVLYGRTLNFLLSKKIVLPFEETKTISELMELYFPLGKIVCDIPLEEITLTLSRPSTLLKCIMSALEEKGLGHKLYFDLKNKEWNFEILKGEDKGLLLCESLLNMYSFEKDESILDLALRGCYYQPATYMGSWDPSSNLPVLSVSPENYAKCYEVSQSGSALGLTLSKGDFIICKDIDGAFEIAEKKEEGFYKYVGEEGESATAFECLLSADNYEDALRELSEKKDVNSVTAKVKNLKLGVDYSLGDIVRISKRIGEKTINEKMKITGVNLWQENADEGEMPLFSKYKEEE